jgi:glycosyltransferase involved in cell wall biosynthesis
LIVKVLWVKSGGFLPLDAGGKIRSFSIARELARRHEVTLFTFYPATKPDPQQLLGEPFVQVRRMPLQIPERGSIRDMLEYTANALTSRPYQMRKYCRPTVGRHLRELLIHGDFDVLLCDFLLTAGVVPWDVNTPTVIFTHNVEQLIWRRHFEVQQNPFWKLIAWREYRTIGRAERHFTRLADHVLTVSDEDRKSFLQFLPENRVTTVPTGVDLDFFRPQTETSRPSPALVFTGSMDWSANEDAILYFSSQILPLIQKRIPEVTFWVVGRKPTRKVVALKQSQPRIHITGAVDDIRPYVHDASAYVVPLRIGSGTRIKIFEAMAMGMPVVSTSIGAEGLPVSHGANILLADSPSEFADNAVALLTQSDLRDRIGDAARSLVERGYGWPTVTNVVENVLQRVADKSSRRVAR